MADAARRLCIADDLRRLPADTSAKVIGGTLVEKAGPSAEHGDAQSFLALLLKGPFQRRGGARRPEDGGS